MASFTGCSAGSLPFSYLGIPVGESMARVKGWQGIIDRFQKRLSSWKSKLLSIGGRLTLLKSVLGSLGIYYFSFFRLPVTVSHLLEAIRSRFFWGSVAGERRMHWVKWEVILNSKENGGLDVGSLDAFNLALLFKWRWRFLNEGDSLWVKVIKFLHGQEGGFSGNQRGVTGGGVWSRIVGSINQLHDSGIIPTSTVFRILGNGLRTRFWTDRWCGDIVFRERFPRLYALSVARDVVVGDCRVGDLWSFIWRREIRDGEEMAQLSSMMAMLDSVTISSNVDSWGWDFDPSGGFSVKSARYHIDDVRLPRGGVVTRWNRFVPIKVNVLLWRLMLDRLPCRVPLVDRGVDLDSVLCPMCQDVPEVTSHVFFGCDTARQVWRRMASWMQVDIPMFQTVVEMVDWIDSRPVVRMERSIVESIFMSVIWVLWTYRNAVVFGRKEFKKQFIFDSICDYAYNWFSSRNPKARFSFIAWVQNPIVH